jgi:hypothetical protein
MSGGLSKRFFSFIFNLGNKAKSQGAKSGEYGGWGKITMLLLVTNSVVFRDVWGGGGAITAPLPRINLRLIKKTLIRIIN